MIQRLRLRNFRRYKDATLPFQPGVNFIEGLNNVGKTTLFYAIEYALFGRVENFKTIRSLMPPGVRSLGVELVFSGKTGERFLLQRAHISPPKSKKTLEGHFTLKELADDGERYLLASDFGDTEDKLALKLQELTGLTRRFFSIALHMRQGDIAAILDGAKQLDIVLGVTAASMAEEELRQMALELEKECSRLAVLEERLRALGNEFTKLTGELGVVGAERQQAADKLAALGELPDPRAEFERRLGPLLASLAACQKKHEERELARSRLADEQERRAVAIKAGAREDSEKELAKLETDSAARAKAMKKLRGELDEIEAEQRKLDQQRGDLTGRIERRKSLPTGKGAKCEMCGQPIKAAQTAKELAEWTAELTEFDKSLTELRTKQTKLRTTLEKENTDEHKQLERVAQLKKHLERLAELDANVVRRQKESDDASVGSQTEFAAVLTEAKTLASYLAAESYEVRWNLEGEPASVTASIREAIQALRQSLAERVGRQLAERQALADLLKRFDAQVQALQKRQTELEREQATTLAEATTLQVKAARAARFRRLSAAFKDLQVQIRSEAASKLAQDTLGLHRQLSERDEFASLMIDPTQYSVHVTPRDLGEEVPAGLYEGGGQRLLLGMAFRLAVSRLVDHTPFLMLDEPTYGLDVAHREALLTRIGNQELAKQVLLVTHQGRPNISGHHILVIRQGRETVVAGPDAPATASDKRD